MQEKQTEIYFDLGEKPYSSKQRRMITVFCLAWGGLSLLAAIMAIWQSRPFFFDVLNPSLFVIISLRLAWEEWKERLHPHGQYYVRINNQQIEFRGIGQKKVETLELSDIKKIERRWATIQIKVEGRTWINLNVFYKNRARIIFEQLQFKIPQLSTP
jgi:hypothetical protein